MTIRTRIIIGFVVSLAACLVLGAVAMQQTSQLSAVVTRFGGEWLPHVTVIGDLRAEINEQRSDVLRHVISGDAKSMADLEAEVVNENGLIDRWFEGAASNFPMGQQRTLLNTAKAAWADYRASTAPVLALSHVGTKEEAVRQIAGPNNAAYRKLVDTVNTMRQLTVLEAWTGVGTAAKNVRYGLVADHRRHGGLCSGVRWRRSADG